jgi:hypothetical protein
MNESQHRNSFLRMFGIAGLAITGGWAGASGAAAFAWMLYPDKKEALIRGFSEKHFIFMPPLFGASPLAYILTAFFVVLLCGLGAVRLAKNR